MSTIDRKRGKWSDWPSENAQLRIRQVSRAILALSQLAVSPTCVTARSSTPSIHALFAALFTECDEASLINPVLQVLAGAGAGAITKTSVAPLERMKVLFQLQGMSKVTASPKYSSIAGVR